jgi:hypothetical protein
MPPEHVIYGVGMEDFDAQLQNYKLPVAWLQSPATRTASQVSSATVMTEEWTREQA